MKYLGRLTHAVRLACAGEDLEVCPPEDAQNHCWGFALGMLHRVM